MIVIVQKDFAIIEFYARGMLKSEIVLLSIIITQGTLPRRAIGQYQLVILVNIQLVNIFHAIFRTDLFQCLK